MSDTPITDRAHQDSKVLNQGIPDKDWPWSAINAGWEFSRELERKYNTLVAKLETLSKEWDEFNIQRPSIYDDGIIKGKELCSEELTKLIQEAKQ